MCEQVDSSQAEKSCSEGVAEGDAVYDVRVGYLVIRQGLVNLPHQCEAVFFFGNSRGPLRAGRPEVTRAASLEQATTFDLHGQLLDVGLHERGWKTRTELSLTRE